MRFSFRDNKSNWERIKAQRPEDTARYRDVYEGQQLERGKLPKRQTMLSRAIGSVLVAVLAASAVWGGISFLQYGLASLKHEAPYIYTDEAGAKTYLIVKDPAEFDPERADPSYGHDVFYDAEGNFLGAEGEGLDPDILLYDKDGARVNADGSKWVDPDDPAPPANPDGINYTSDDQRNIKYVLWRDGHYKLYRESTSAISDWYTDNQTGEAIQESDILAKFYQAYHAGYVDDYLKAIGKGDASGMAPEDGGEQAPSGDGGEFDPWLSDYRGPFYDGDGNPIPGDTEDVGQALYDDQGNLVRQSTAMMGTEPEEEPMVNVPGVGLAPKSSVEKVKWTYYLLAFAGWKVLLTLLTGLGVFGAMYAYLSMNLKVQNALTDYGELNQYENDQHIQLPEEMQENYEWFPDVGAHAPIQVSSMISHMMLSPRGLKSVQVARRADKDIVGKDGEVIYFKGEALRDADGEVIMDTKPLIDEKFGSALYDASGAPKGKNFRKRYLAKGIQYNPGDANRDKLTGAETVADAINKYWTFPEYEPQRPAGAYLIDTAPVNTIRVRFFHS